MTDDLAAGSPAPHLASKARRKDWQREFIQAHMSCQGMTLRVTGLSKHCQQGGSVQSCWTPQGVPAAVPRPTPKLHSYLAIMLECSCDI